MKKLLLLLVLATHPVFADDAALTLPTLFKPDAALHADDPLRGKYDAAWAGYESVLADVRKKVSEALNAQFEKSADAGDLDLAEMWTGKKKRFADTGTVSWEADAKTKEELYIASGQQCRQEADLVGSHNGERPFHSGFWLRVQVRWGVSRCEQRDRPLTCIGDRNPKRGCSA